MTKETKKSVKERQGLKSQLPRTRKENLLPLLQNLKAARERLRSGEDGDYCKRAKRIRLAQLQEEILGPNPTFGGSIIIPKDYEARADDFWRLSDIAEACATGTAIVYFTDGSYKSEGPRGGFLGAGVAWWYRGRLAAQGYQLGRFVGEAPDAELFALTAALSKAMSLVEEGEKLEHVRVYSDALGLLEGLLTNNLLVLGPLKTEYTTLQELYERADWLIHRNIKVEVVWVKGHSESAGNDLADWTAAQALSEQAQPDGLCDSIENALTRELKTEADAPEIWQDLGQHWVAEWLARANRGLAGEPLTRIERNKLLRFLDTISHNAKFFLNCQDGFDDYPSDREDIKLLDAQISQLSKSIAGRTIKIRVLQDEHAASTIPDLQLTGDLGYAESMQMVENIALTQKIHERQTILQTPEPPMDYWVGDPLLAILDQLLAEALLAQLDIKLKLPRTQKLTSSIEYLKGAINEREDLIRSEIRNRRLIDNFESAALPYPYLESIQASDMARLAELIAERDTLQSAVDSRTDPETAAWQDTNTHQQLPSHDVRPVATLEQLRAGANLIAGIKSGLTPDGRFPLAHLEKKQKKAVKEVNFMAICNEGYKRCVLAGRDIFEIEGL